MSSTPLIIIPARMDSKRLPGKPLLMAGGKPLIQHTYERALKTGYDVKIVTPDEEIENACTEFTENVFCFQSNVSNGTARCADFIKQWVRESPSIIINWQCDEPQVDYHDVQTTVSLLASAWNPATIYTLVSPPKKEHGLEFDPESGVVYAITEAGQCYWFSRTPTKSARVHVGVYIFTGVGLSRAARAAPTGLGTAEGLEQLPWIQAGMRIRACDTTKFARSINTHVDFGIFKAVMESG